jgi:NAD(P)-dependent dehydrogenase (short-subunit alcohol dehydrogenase family)
MPETCIVVTGASKGIGRAIAVELDKRGLAVVGLSRSADSPVGEGHSCDMTDEAAVRDVLAAIAKARPIAGLVNNAGLHIGSPSAALPTAEYEKVMALNATAVMVASREAHPYLKETAGKIVNIGSFFDKLGVPDNLAYCASKAAVAAMTRCLAVEWAGDGIRVMNVAPGYIETDLNRAYLARDKIRKWMAERIPVGHVGQPEDVARMVAALFCEDIPFLTGETIYLDGGQGMNH